MAPDPCPACGLNRNIVGRMHRCVPRQAAPAKASPNDMANSARSDVANSASATYRYRNADQRRAYQRELMRKRRARAGSPG